MIICAFNSYANKDGGAAIIRDTGKTGDPLEYVAISEERLSRVKYAYFSPIRSIRYCMQAMGIDNLDEIDLFVTDWCSRKTFINSNPSYRKLENDYIMHRLRINREKLHFTPTHHYAHAASAYYPSGYDDAAILVIDGMGSQAEAISLYRAHGDVIELVEQCKSQSIGLLYTAVTRQLLGFGTGQEGKTMGLAPYGKNVNKKVLDIQGSYGNLQIDYSRFMDRYPERRILQDDLVPCKDSSKVTDDYYARIAYEIQDEVERACLHLAAHAKKIVKSRNLCLAGGVALNCVANWKIVESGLFKNVFIQPAASDAGLPLGMALGEYYQRSLQKKRMHFKNAYTGIKYGRDIIRRELDDLVIPYREIDDQGVAGLIAEGNIVGWFFGESEYGPRALGHRSILADPRNPGARDMLNLKVKHREIFRPFAPAILEEKAAEYFKMELPSPFMLLAPMTHREAIDRIPSVVHVDGTARVQTVSSNNCSRFYHLIECFEKITGVPVLLNTSFNDNGEPIVETPIDALLCFMRTHMDYLVLEGFLVDKRALTDSQRSELVVRISQLRDQRLKEDYQRALQQLCRGYNAAEMRRYLRQEKDRATYHLNYKAYDRLEEKIVECCERGLSVSILCDREHGRIFKKLEASHCLRISSEIVIVDDHESLRGCDLKGLFPADVVIVALFNMAFRAEEALRSMWDGDIYMVYDRYTRKITCACELLDFQQDRNTVHDLHLHSAEYNGNCDWDKYFCSLDDVSRDDYTNTEI